MNVSCTSHILVQDLYSNYKHSEAISTVSLSYGETHDLIHLHHDIAAICIFGVKQHSKNTARLCQYSNICMINL